MDRLNNPPEKGQTKKILATRKMRVAIMEKYGVSPTLVSQALNFKRNSRMAREIRMYAINKLNAAPFIQ